jgi:hypothetical protein
MSTTNDIEPPRNSPSSENQEETPPLGSWKRMYALVLANLVLLIVLFYAFTRAFD